MSNTFQLFVSLAELSTNAAHARTLLHMPSFVTGVESYAYKATQDTAEKTTGHDTILQ